MIARARLPNRRLQATETIRWQTHAWALSVGFDQQGQAREAFLAGTRSGSDIEALADDGCVLLSIMLQMGVSAERLAQHLGSEGIYDQAPHASLLGFVAAKVAEIAGELDGPNADKIGSMIVAAISQNLTNKTWLRGISDLVEAASNPERYGERWLQSLAGTVVPTGVAQVAQVQDPVLRETRTMLDRIRSRIPGVSKELPPRRNVWGEPIILGGGLGPDLVSPIYTSRDKHDLVADEVVRLELKLSKPTRRIHGVELTPELYDEYLQLSGKPAKDRLDQLVQRPNWAQIPDYFKRELIIEIMTRTRKVAREEMLRRYPNLGHQRAEGIRRELQGVRP